MSKLVLSGSMKTHEEEHHTVFICRAKYSGSPFDFCFVLFFVFCFVFFNSVLWFVHAEGLCTAGYLSQDSASSFCFDKANVLASYAILKSISHLFFTVPTQRTSVFNSSV